MSTATGQAASVVTGDDGLCGPKPIKDLFVSQEASLPLVVGLVGHSDARAEELDQLQAKTRSVLQHLADAWNSQDKPRDRGMLVLLTTLTARTERVAARLALEAGYKLVVAAPQAHEPWRKQFNEQELAEYGQLWNSASAHMEWSSRQDDCTESGEPCSLEDMQERLGAYIARHCYVLLALCDDNGDDKPADPSQIVHMKLYGCVNRCVSDRDLLDIQTVGPVCQIVTPRRGRITPFDAFKIRVQWPEVDSRPQVADSIEEIDGEMLLSVLQRLRDYNHDWYRLAGACEGQLRRSEGYLVPEGQCPPELAFLRRQFAVADVLASHFQRLTVRLLHGYMALVLLAGLLLGIYYYYYPLIPGAEAKTILLAPTTQGHAIAASTVRQVPDLAGEPEPELLAANTRKEAVHTMLARGYMLIILTMIAVYVFVNRRRYFARYRDYRALAEGLRVQFYWRMAGIDRCVADYYLNHQVSELDWIRCAIKGLDMQPSRASETARNLPLVRQLWLTSQLQYFRETSRRCERTAQLFGWLTFVPLGAAVLWAPAKVLAKRVSEVGYSTGGNTGWVATSVLLVLLASAGSVAVALGTYSHFRGFANQAKRYRKMLPLFARARRFLEILEMAPADSGAGARDGQTAAAPQPSGQAVSRITGKPVKATDVLLELGQQALAENADWLILHHQRKIDLPK